MFSFQGAFWVSSSRNSMKSHFHGTSVNSLTFHFQLSIYLWWRVPGSNRWPPACKAGALPAELTPRLGTVSSFSEVVGQNGLEPSTSRLSVVCSSQLSYWPILVFTSWGTSFRSFSWSSIYSQLYWAVRNELSAATRRELCPLNWIT